MSELPWISIARSYLGLTEGPGALDNPAVLKLYALAGHPEVKHDDTAWCAAFVGAVLKQAGFHASGSLMAKSYTTWGRRLSGPIYGCIGVKDRRGAPKGSPLGHVFFVLGANQYEIIGIGGNQNDRVSIAAYPRHEFCAYRWPSAIPLPVPPLPLPSSVAGASVAPKEN